MRQCVKSAVIVLMLVALGVAVLPPTAIGDALLPYPERPLDAAEADDSPWADGDTGPTSSVGLYRVTMTIALSVYDAIYGAQTIDEQNKTDAMRQNDRNDDAQNVTTFR